MWDKFKALLPEEVIKTIASIELFPSIQEDDQWSWVGTPNDNFSIKSALGFFWDSAQEERNPLWTAIWKARIPQRIRFFLSLVGHDRIMSNSNRERRGLTPDPSCPNYPGVFETTLHILRDCP